MAAAAVLVVVVEGAVGGEVRMVMVAKVVGMTMPGAEGRATAMVAVVLMLVVLPRAKLAKAARVTSGVNFMVLLCE